MLPQEADKVMTEIDSVLQHLSTARKAKASGEKIIQKELCDTVDAFVAGVESAELAEDSPVAELAKSLFRLRERVMGVAFLVEEPLVHVKESIGDSLIQAKGDLQDAVDELLKEARRELVDVAKEFKKEAGKRLEETARDIMDDEELSAIEESCAALVAPALSFVGALVKSKAAMSAKQNWRVREVAALGIHRTIDALRRAKDAIHSGESSELESVRQRTSLELETERHQLQQLLMRRRCFEPIKAVRGVLKEGHTLAASLNETSPRAVRGLTGSAADAQKCLLDGLDAHADAHAEEGAQMSGQKQLLERLLQLESLLLAKQSTEQQLTHAVDDQKVAWASIQSQVEKDVNDLVNELEDDSEN